MNAANPRRPDFNQLIAEHGGMVARICASYEANRDLARELAQEVWFAVWRALPSYRGESSAKTFVARIAQFRAISHVADHARQPRNTPLDPDLLSQLPAPEAATIAAGERNRVLLAVQGLPIAYRQPVTLTLEDFSPAEIATMLGLTTNVVSVRLTRARALLRRALEGETV